MILEQGHVAGRHPCDGPTAWVRGLMVTLIGCAEGFFRHLCWWINAFVRPNDVRAPLRWRRALILLGILPLALIVQLIHAVFLLLDEIIFPRYRRMNVGPALFITGIPRSGTTALHRAIGADTDDYTTFSTWEAVFAPAISQRRLIHGVRRLDAALGGHLQRVLQVTTRRITGRLDEIHRVDLGAAEEDYLSLLPAGSCYLLVLVFPGAEGVRALGHLHRMAPQRRRRLMAFYNRMLQRHLYVNGRGRMLLSKNAAFGSWLSELGGAFPQARFLVCIRDPVEALTSQIGAVQSAAPLFGTQVNSAAFQQIFVDMFAEALTEIAQTVESWRLERAAVVGMADLRRAPEKTILAALDQLGLKPSSSLILSLKQMQETAAGQCSSHQPPAILRESLEETLLPAYMRIHRLPHCLRVAS